MVRAEPSRPSRFLAMFSPYLRVAAFLVGYFLILFAAAIPKGMAPRALADVVWGTLSSVAILAVTHALLTRERRTRADVGLAVDARSWARLVGGFAVGLGVYVATVLATSLTLGPIRVSAVVPQRATTWGLVTLSFLALACMEELGFRAYALRTLMPHMGGWQAQLCMAIIFGLSHLASGWPWTTVVLGVIPSGLLFGVAAVRSGGLAFPIGLHAALNVAYWAVGAKETPGVWTLSADPAHLARVNSYAPFVAVAITLLSSLAIARWPSKTHAGSIVEGPPRIDPGNAEPSR